MITRSSLVALGGYDANNIRPAAQQALTFVHPLRRAGTEAARLYPHVRAGRLPENKVTRSGGRHG